MERERIKTNRKADTKKEQILSIYLDKYYDDRGLGMTRVTDKHLQLSGVDIYNKTDLIDEKAQTSYLNKHLKTFSFEISSINRDGERIKGWLFDKTKKTTHYYLISSIMLHDEKPNLENPEDVSSLKILALPRQNLINHLDSKGYGEVFCKEREEFHLSRNHENGISIPNETDYYFYHSTKYGEKPFNIIIKYDVLEKLGKYI